MFRRNVKSALFIDYENVSHRSLPATIAKWLAWLEDGEFEEGRRRRRSFVEKRIYWNTMAEQHRERFESAGFTAVLCEKFSGLKNGADIRMALDVQDAMIKQKHIREFILITRDSDFVPVLQRLAQNARETAILVSEQTPQVYTTYSHFADIIIPLRKFMAATEYVRPARSLLGWRRGPSVAANPEISPEPQKDLVALATDYVIRVASLKPNLYTSRVEIERELRKIPAFATNGRNPYLGRGSYRALMLELATRSDRLVVVPALGTGVNVRYVPKDEGD
jgi:hypothetical protein